MSPTGLTKDAGWQIGARRTFAVSPRQAWDALTSTEGIALWLGNAPDFRLEKGTTYRTADGATGEVRVLTLGAHRHVRLTWQPPDWQKPSTIQVRVDLAGTGDRTTISFHQENLPDAKAREQMHRRWQDVLDKLAAILADPL